MMSGSNKKLDERQEKLLNNAMAISAVIAYLYEIIIIIYRYSKTKDIKSVYLEIILISTMFVCMVAFYIITGVHDSSIEKTKIKGKFFSKLDERQRNRIIKSLGMSTFVAFFSSIFMIIFKFIYTKSLESAYTEITLGIIISVTIILYHLSNKEYDVPKTLSGKILPIGNSKRDKRSRLVYYIKDSIPITITFSIFDIMAPDRIIIPVPLMGSKVLSYTLNSLIRFIVFFIIDYLWGEYNVRKQNIFNASLEHEE